MIHFVCLKEVEYRRPDPKSKACARPSCEADGRDVLCGSGSARFIFAAVGPWCDWEYSCVFKDVHRSCRSSVPGPACLSEASGGASLRVCNELSLAPILIRCDKSPAIALGGKGKCTDRMTD